MRFKSAVVLLMIVVIGTTTFPVTGQEEPLPAIQAKGSLAPLTPSIVLPTEPASVALPPQTLESAARANDFITFDALYREAMRRGQSAASFSTLYELWTYGITDPVGAFYDGDIYERLSRAYPGYASYIAQYRIVDSNGHVFYPTSETRAFLLERALEGDAPKVQLVEARRTTQRVELRETTEGSIWSGHTATTSRASRTSRTSPQRSTTTSRREGTSTARQGTSTRRSSPKASSHPAAVASTSTPAPTKSAVAQKTPAVADKTPVVTDKAPAVAEKQPPVATESSTQQPIVSDASTPTTTAATTSAEAPVVVRPETTDVAKQPVVDTPPVTTPQPTAADENRFGGRGILLLVIGLVGVGLLAMMLRAPREVPTSIMPTPSNGPDGDKAPGDKASGPVPVEPLRRPSAAPPPPPPPPGKNRAGGSHG